MSSLYTADCTVAYGQAQSLSDALNGVDVYNELILVEGGTHTLGSVITGNYMALRNFMDTHMMEEPPMCPEVMCFMHCESGYVQDDNGCDTCECIETEWCPESSEQLCRRPCSDPTCSEGQCALRDGTCCDYTCTEKAVEQAVGDDAEVVCT